MWWKVVMAVFVVVVAIAIWGMRAFFRSLLDPCPDEQCSGRMKYLRDEDGKAVYGCDRCPEMTAVSVTDEQPAL